MDIQKSRERFERLPKIVEKIKRSRLNFSKSLNRYLISSMSDDDQFDCDVVNGAWYAFQEQQKQINEIKAMAESWINQDYTHNSDSTDIKIQQMKDCGRDIIRKINGE